MVVITKAQNHPPFGQLDTTNKSGCGTAFATKTKDGFGRINTQAKELSQPPTVFLSEGLQQQLSFAGPRGPCAGFTHSVGGLRGLGQCGVFSLLCKAHMGQTTSRSEQNEVWFWWALRHCSDSTSWSPSRVIHGSHTEVEVALM